MKIDGLKETIKKLSNGRVNDIQLRIVGHLKIGHLLDKLDVDYNNQLMIIDLLNQID